MSLAAGNRRWNPFRRRLSLLWGTRFTFAATGFYVSLWWITKWIQDAECISLGTWGPGGVLSRFALFPVVCLFFLLWIGNLLWEQKLFLIQWKQLTTGQQRLFAAIFAVGMALGLGLYYESYIQLAPNATEAYFARLFLFVFLWVTSFCWVSSGNARRETQSDSGGKDAVAGPVNRWNFGLMLALCIVLSLFLAAILTDPCGLADQDSFGWVRRIGLVVFILVFPAVILGLNRIPMWLFRLILWLVKQGKYEWSLYANRLYMHTPGHRESLDGWIFLEAGRYTEALACFKPLAFDENGQPRLSSMELYFYATALLGEDRYSESQELFEAAIRVPQASRYFHYGLAGCLLGQNREAGRASDLIDQVMAERHAQLTPSQQRTHQTQCIALGAWALAKQGRREDAIAKLQEAFAESAGLNKHDLAGLLHLKGVTWKALGGLEEARAAFQEALTLFPRGAVMLRARKRLMELAENGCA